MKVELEYGRQGLVVDLPDANVRQVLELKPMTPLEAPREAVAESLRHPIGGRPLAELARPARKACVVVCDITRPVPNKIILPPLLECLESSGLAKEDITLLIATGSHRPNWGAELEEMIGADLARTYRVVNHEARNEAEQGYVGRTSRGVEVYVNKTYLEADLKIITGLIEPHFMAGWSGGRKIVCPGITALKTVYYFHSPALLEDERATNGILEGNPCHEMALEVAHLAGVDFSLNVVIDQQRRIAGVFAGDLEEAHLAGVAFAEQFCRVPVPEPVDIVVTTSAGYPLDATFYQAVKGLVGALPILKPGGTVIEAAELSEGIGGPEFTQMLMETNHIEEFLQKILQPGFFLKDQWEVEMLARVLRRGEVLIYEEGVPPEEMAQCLVTPVPSVEEGVQQALAKHGPHATIAVIPAGPYLIPYVE